MDAGTGIQLLEHALKKEEEDLLFSRWIQGAQYTMSFDDFKASLTRRDKPTEEVLADVDNIMEAFEKER